MKEHRFHTISLHEVRIRPGQERGKPREARIDFEAAQAIWDDEALIVAPARAEDEPRWLAIGRIGRRHRMAIYTLRDGAVRIISVRRARGDEIDAYQGR